MASSMAPRGLQTRVSDSVGVWLGVRLEAWLFAERNQLPLLAPVALGIGVALWFVLPWAGERWAALAVAAALVAGGLALSGLSIGGRAARLLAWGGLLVALGIGSAAWRSAQVAAPVLADRFSDVVTGTVESIEVVRGGERFRFLLLPDDKALPPRIRISAKGVAMPGVVPGARVSIRASLNPPSGPSVPGGYDFARKAWFAGVGATGYPLGDVTILRAALPPSGALARLAGLRAAIDAQLTTAVPGPAGAIAAAFVTGNQGMIPPQVNQEMRDAGLAHLLSISGLHIAIVVGGTLWAVRRALTIVPWLALRLPVKALAAGAAASAGIAYTLLAGGEVPTVRSCIATLIVLIGVAIGREALTLRLVAAAAFLILLIRPESLLGPSFQLSFAAVTGIVALYQSRLGRWLAEPVHTQGWIVRTVRHLLMLLVTGLVAEAMLAATALYHFNRAGLYGVFANLIAIPWTSFIVMPLLIVALIAGALRIGAPFEWLLGKSMELLIELARTVAGWPGAVFRLPLMPDGAYLLLICGGLWLCIWQGRSRFLGLLPLAAGGVAALLAQPPDLLVSADGRHAAYLVPDGRLAFLRDRAGDYIRDMWGDATAASTADVALSELPGARCSLDACVADLDAGGRRWRLLATLSKDVVPREAMAPACAAADIVVSMRRLPAWCAPRWLKLDRAALGETGAVAIWLDPPRVTTVAARLRDHPWLPKPAPWHPRRTGRPPKVESWD